MGHDDIGTGVFGKLGNVVWVIIADFWLAIGYTLSAAITAITIIGIPFAIQHIKLAKLAFAPIVAGAVRVILLVRVRMASATICASILARGAPRQRWMPWPKPMWRLG